MGAFRAIWFFFAVLKASSFQVWITFPGNFSMGSFKKYVHLELLIFDPLSPYLSLFVLIVPPSSPLQHMFVLVSYTLLKKGLATHKFLNEISESESEKRENNFFSNWTIQRKRLMFFAQLYIQWQYKYLHIHKETLNLKKKKCQCLFNKKTTPLYTGLGSK